MTAGGQPREESPDFIERDARCKPGRGDPTESATENRPPSASADGKGETVG